MGVAQSEPSEFEYRNVHDTFVKKNENIVLRIENNIYLILDNVDISGTIIDI